MGAVGIEILLSVIDGHSTIDTIGQGRVLHDRYALVRSVRMLEEHDGRPVIGEVLGESTCCARSLFADIACHIGFEGVTTDNLVQMDGRQCAWLDERVETLDAESRTSESECGL